MIASILKRRFSTRHLWNIKTLIQIRKSQEKNSVACVVVVAYKLHTHTHTYPHCCDRYVTNISRFDLADTLQNRTGNRERRAPWICTEAWAFSTLLRVSDLKNAQVLVIWIYQRRTIGILINWRFFRRGVLETTFILRTTIKRLSKNVTSIYFATRLDLNWEKVLKWWSVPSKVLKKHYYSIIRKKYILFVIYLEVLGILKIKDNKSSEKERGIKKSDINNLTMTCWL